MARTPSGVERTGLTACTQTRLDKDGKVVAGPDLTGAMGSRIVRPTRQAVRKDTEVTTMKRLLTGLLAAVMLTGGSAALTVAQDATPSALDQLAGSQAENAVDPKIGDTVTFYGEDGSEVGLVTVESIERGWDAYDEYYEPEEGTEYVAFVITVESTIARGAIDVEAYDFSLQTANGYLWGRSYVSSEAADPALLDDTVSLAGGDSETFTVVFQVLEGEGLGHLFWQPDSGVLITAAQLEGE